MNMNMKMTRREKVASVFFTVSFLSLAFDCITAAIISAVALAIGTLIMNA